MLGHHPCLGIHNISSNIVIVDDSVEFGVGILGPDDGNVGIACIHGHIVDLSTGTFLKIFTMSTLYATMTTMSTARQASSIF